MPESDSSLLQIVHFAELTRWSVHEASFREVKSRFPLVPLSQLLKRALEPIDVKDDQLYKRITVRLYGQGVLQRDEVSGKKIGTKRQCVAHAGQLILSRIDARNGAFGIVPAELDNAIVTNDFWLFEVQDALPQYVMLVLSSNQFQHYWQTKSTGTTNRQRISEVLFLEAKIALPPIDRQHELVNTYSDKQNQAKNFARRAQSITTAIDAYLLQELGIKKIQSASDDSLIKFIHFATLSQWGVDKNINSFPYRFEKFKAFSFADKPSWVRLFLRGKSPRYNSNSSLVILNQKCNRKDLIDISFAKAVDPAWLSKLDKKNLTQEHDILINSTGEGTLGRASLVTKQFKGLAYDSHMLLLRVNTAEVDARLIVDLFNSSFGAKQVEIFKSAEATKQTELGIENAKRFLFPLPCLPEQKRIADAIEQMKNDATCFFQRAKEYRLQAKSDFEKAVSQ